MHVAKPNNAEASDADTVIAYNRFSRNMGPEVKSLPIQKEMSYWTDDEEPIKERPVQTQKNETTWADRVV